SRAIPAAMISSCAPYSRSVGTRTSLSRCASSLELRKDLARSDGTLLGREVFPTPLQHAGALRGTPQPVRVTRRDLEHRRRCWPTDADAARTRHRAIVRPT